MNDSMRMGHTPSIPLGPPAWITPVPNSAAKKNAQVNWTTCEPTKISWRDIRSANTPPTSEKRTIGMLPRKESTPSHKGEPESSNTSQLCAMICIQVPMLEIQAPVHMMLKSRYWKALKTLVSNRDSDQG